MQKLLDKFYETKEKEMNLNETSTATRDPEDTETHRTRGTLASENNLDENNYKNNTDNDEIKSLIKHAKQKLKLKYFNNAGGSDTRDISSSDSENSTSLDSDSDNDKYDMNLMESLETNVLCDYEDFSEIKSSVTARMANINNNK